MIHVKFNPKKLRGKKRAEWEKLTKRAERATRTLLRKWEAQGHLTSEDFNSGIWQDVKKWLLKNVFHGKCAYCEIDLSQARQEGEGEHFRPKLGVHYLCPNQSDLAIAARREPGVVQSVRYRLCYQCPNESAPVVAMTEDEDGMSRPHPGYFWLAYHWKNLLPSCSGCNGAPRGKQNQFPIRNQHVFRCRLTDAERGAFLEPPLPAPKPDVFYPGWRDLDRLEERLLLHPYLDHPDQHLRFGECGAISGITSMGDASVVVYNLRSDGLRETRRARQQFVYELFNQAFQEGRLKGLPRDQCLLAGWQVIQKEIAEDKPFSAASTAYVSLYADPRP